MSKNLEPKCKQCRRVGEKMLLKGERCLSAKCAMVKRNYPPGFHGPKGRKRLSDFGTQLAEKQKAKKTYHLLEKQFRLTFESAKKKKGDLSENFIRSLEMRLDNVIYRLGYAVSRPQAREMISHGHFLVKDQKVNIPSFMVKAGDVIKIRNSSKNNKIFKDLPEKLKNQSAKIPGWLNLDSKAMEAKVLHQPGSEDLKTSINTKMVVEFYSR